ncbi:MAG: carbohydrate binding family 9 domain-containing protein [Acidobacteriota bacterium]|nr:carbohydrate binding family 9 domain-containing protein [Acidobacteriota bacterium]
MTFWAVKRKLWLGVAVLGLLWGGGVARAQVTGEGNGLGKPTVASEAKPKSQPLPDAKVPLLSEPISLRDFPGMEPRAGLKEQLGYLTQFIQQEPVDGAAATERTEVYLGRTKTTLYLVFLCFDRHPELIRAHLARRENILSDDNVNVKLDPFQDRQRGVEFKVNPYGVQADAEWTETNGPDYSYDQVWDSDAQITPKGWMALIAIPFRSLRFSPKSTDWGAVFGRNFPRNSESDFWPRISASVSGQLSQEGTLHLDGLTGVAGSHNIQVVPYALAQNEHTLETLDPMNPYFSTRHAEATAGGEVKAVLKDSIVLDATVNPDFSDVESDQPQFTVNQRYPVFFPELRPFFLENASYFATPLALLYTRNIIRPEFGARITGKLGRTNLGVLAIDDREPGDTARPGDPLYGRRAGFFVGRASQDLGKGSNVGLMYTDEEFGDGFNRIGGADFTWRANDHWTLLGQMVESATEQNNPRSMAAIFPAGYQAGPATDFQVQRQGHSFSMFAEYQDISRGFTTGSGFLQTANIRSGHVHGTYQWFPKRGKIQSYGVETDQNLAFDHAHNRVYHYSTVNTFVQLANNVILAPVGGENSDTVGPQDGHPVTENRNFTENFGGFVAKGQPSSKLNFNLQGLKSGGVNYNPLPGQAPFELHQETVQALISINPLRHLTNDNTYLLDRDHAAEGGQFVYETQTFRTKLNYQFTKAWSARVIVEYDSTLANPVETSLRRTKQVQTQALLTWLPHPGTVLYIGYNGDLQNYNHQFCSVLAESGACDPLQPILPRGPAYLNDGRQFFIKASYLLRF